MTESENIGCCLVALFIALLLSFTLSAYDAHYKTGLYAPGTPNNPARPIREERINHD